MSSQILCQDRSLHEIGSRLLRKAKLDAHIANIRTFTDTEYSKVYSAYRLETSSGSSYVLKRTEILPELYTYQNVFTKGDPVPSLYEYDVIDNAQCWLLQEHVGDTDIRNLDLQQHLSAVRSLAVFHANHWLENRSTYRQLSDWQAEFSDYTAILETYVARPVDPDINRIQTIYRDIFHSLSQSAPTVIHGDLLSMNILYDGNTTKLVDWGATMIGCYAVDLGRWLGDLRHANTAKWIPMEWEKILLKAYYSQQMELLGNRWNTWERMTEESNLAALCA